MAGTVPLKAPKGSHVEAPNMEHDSPPNLSQFNLSFRFLKPWNWSAKPLVFQPPRHQLFPEFVRQIQSTTMLIRRTARIEPPFGRSGAQEISGVFI